MNTGVALAALAVVDEDANGAELNRFELHLPAGTLSVEALLRARLVADLERVDRDHPELHVALVQALRSRERGDEIELFTAPLVDVQAQIDVALAGLERGDLALTVNAVPLRPGDAPIALAPTNDVRFVRHALLVGG